MPTQMAIANYNSIIEIKPGEEATVRLSHETWPSPWPDDTPMMLLAPHALLRVPAYGDGGECVIELTKAATLFPQRSIGFSVCALYDGRMHRIASGQLRRAD